MPVHKIGTREEWLAAALAPHATLMVAAASSIAVCASCPQACIMPGTKEAHGSPARSSTG